MVRHVYSVLVAGLSVVVCALMTWRAADAFGFSDCSTLDTCMSYDDGTETYCSTSITCRDTWKAGCFCVSGKKCVNVLQTVTTTVNPYTGESSEKYEEVANITSLEGCDYLTLGYGSEEKSRMCHSLCDGPISFSQSQECVNGRYVDKVKVYYLPEDPCTDQQAGTCDLAANAGGLLTCLETAQRVYSYCNLMDTDTTGVDAACGAVDHKGDLHSGPIFYTNITGSLCDPENITTTFYFFTTEDQLCGLSLRINYNSPVAENSAAICGNTVIQPGTSSSYSEVYSAIADNCTSLLVESTELVPHDALQTACADVCTSTGTNEDIGLPPHDTGDVTPSCASTLVRYPRDVAAGVMIIWV